MQAAGDLNRIACEHVSLEKGPSRNASPARRGLTPIEPYLLDTIASRLSNAHGQSQRANYAQGYCCLDNVFNVNVGGLGRYYDNSVFYELGWRNTKPADYG